MASEVQMLNQGVDTAFAEEEAKDVEESRDDWKLNMLEDFQGLLSGGLLAKEGVDMIKGFKESSMSLEERIAKGIKEGLDAKAIADEVGSTGLDDTPDDPDFKSTEDLADNTTVVSDDIVKKIDIDKADDNVSSNDYIAGTNLKSFGQDQSIVNRPWMQGMSMVAKVAFGWGKNKEKQ
jgi:hypothetical protein